MQSVSVVVRADHTDQEVIDAVLDAVRAQRGPSVDEIILVDSSPEGRGIQVTSVERVQRLRLRRADFSYGGALNLGCSNASGSVLVTLNGHTIPIGRGWLDGMLSTLREVGAAGVCGCQSGLWPQGRVLKPTVLTRENFGPPWWLGLSTANLAMPREIWERFPFDGSVRYGEDKEWGRRVVLGGHSIVVKAPAVIFHSHPERRARDELKHRWWAGYCMARFALTQRSPPSLFSSIASGLRAAMSTVVHMAYVRSGFRSGLFERDSGDLS